MHRRPRRSLTAFGALSKRATPEDRCLGDAHTPPCPPHPRPRRHGTGWTRVPARPHARRPGAEGGSGLRYRPKSSPLLPSCAAQRMTSELIISKTGPGCQPWAPPAPASPTALPPHSSPVSTEVSTMGFGLDPHPGVGSPGLERPLTVPETLGRAVTLTPAGRAPRATAALQRWPCGGRARPRPQS